MRNSTPTLTVAESKSSYGYKQRWWQVLVDVTVEQDGGDEKGEKLFTYSAPEDLEVRSGDILSVPFGPQTVGGIAVRPIDTLPPELPPEKVRSILDIITAGFFPPHYWELLGRVSRYFCADFITVIRIALPPGLLRKSQRRIRLKPQSLPNGFEVFCSPRALGVIKLLQSQKEGDYTAQYLQRNFKGAYQGIQELIKKGWVESYLETPKTTNIKQQKVVTMIVDGIPKEVSPTGSKILGILRRHGGELTLEQLKQLAEINNIAPINTLAKSGYVVISEREQLRLLSGPDMKPDRAKVLTPAQKYAVEKITGLEGYQQVLLHGVTGSGKTEVYLQAIAPIITAGKSALVLVPEIGLTPQLTDRFRARFGDIVRVYHSGLSDGERYDTWRQMLTGEPQVVIGTRSAIFAPLPHLGLIILDEEHDTSFKQTQLIPNYHARTVAQWRAGLISCPLVLGSATPALETWFQSGATPDRYISLPQRVNDRPLPTIAVVDMRKELQAGNRSLFSRSLQLALKQLSETGKQGILFINRRGHSTFVSCRSCGYVVECPHCDVSLSYHYGGENTLELLRCHYCNYNRLHPKSCPECNSPYLKFFGSGTQKVIEELSKNFPNLRAIRFDSDTTSTKGSHRSLLDGFARGEADILVGTQMLTKGLDIAGVTLVGVVAADGLLYHSDYRAAERAFQTLTQVAGGRAGEKRGVIIQTYTPEHPVIRAVQIHDYEGFVELELDQRQELNYPPYGCLVLLKFSGLEAQEVQQCAEVVGQACENLMGAGVEILGPAPANVMRVARRYRWQILLKCGGDNGEVLEKLPLLRPFVSARVNMTIDVDPMMMD
ncbi:MAG: primosomal protein N' [Chroococcopsis gigantea SAG 12.99]|nr:primosomal protein N' [Chroococcopsis gigantea SAG 12.99]